MAPRTAKPKPAAIRVKKLAIKSARLLFIAEGFPSVEGIRVEGLVSYGQNLASYSGLQVFSMCDTTVLETRSMSD
jgi:hypothetical protein